MKLLKIGATQRRLDSALERWTSEWNAYNILVTGHALRDPSNFLPRWVGVCNSPCAASVPWSPTCSDLSRDAFEPPKALSDVIFNDILWITCSATSLRVLYNMLRGHTRVFTIVQDSDRFGTHIIRLHHGRMRRVPRHAMYRCRFFSVMFPGQSFLRHSVN